MRKYLLVLLVVISLLIAAIIYGFSRVDVSLQWRNQAQDASTISQGSYISLQAEGMDAHFLNLAILSTNETGEWKNETDHAFLWSQPCVHGFDNFGTATYKDGILYAPSKAEDKVCAVNALDGNIIWNKTVRQCDASPCIDGDVIYVGECIGPNHEPIEIPKALALNRTTGETIWEYIEPHNSTWVGSPVVIGDCVYYTTFGSGIYALNKTNGNPIWNQNIGTIVCSVAYDEGAVFVSAYDPPSQYAFNATTGDVIWHQTYGSSWDSSPIVYEGMVIQVVRNTTTSVWTTYVLNETDGTLIRTFDGNGSTATPLVKNGIISIPSNDWKMWTFNLTTGNEIWHTTELHDGTFQNYSYCSPAASDGAIYFQALNGTFYVLNETDGNVLWSYRLGGYGFGSISIGDGCVFVSNDAALYAFKMGSGSGDWPMFCKNQVHRSFSDQGVEYVRYPLTEPKDFGNIANTWVTARFIWCNRTIASAAICWKICFFDGEGNMKATDVKTFYIDE